MNKSQPFARAMHIAAMAMAAMQSGIAGAMNNVPAYTSRGHGRGVYSGKGNGNPGTNWMAILKGKTNGKRECARRLRQMERSAAKFGSQQNQAEFLKAA